MSAVVFTLLALALFILPGTIEIIGAVMLVHAVLRALP